MKSARAKINRGVDLVSEALPFGRLWYGEPNAISNAIGYAMHRSRSHDAVVRIYDRAGNGGRQRRMRGASHFSPSCHTPFQSVPGGFRRKT